jgi:integrin beta 3
MLDGKEFGEEVVGLVRGYVEREIGPLKAANEALTARVAELETAAKKPIEIDLTAVEKLFDAKIAELPVPELVKEVDREELAAAIGLAVDEAVAELPQPEKGDPGEPGKDADPEALQAAIDAAVAKAVEALPMPKDGAAGKDAAGIVEVLKDNGELVLTLQDGRLIRTGVRDGEKGQDGRDGFGFDDMDVAVLDDDRTIELLFRRGEEEKAFTLKWPTVIYRGVWHEADYAAGDSVTWGGSLWIAEKDTAAKPDTAESGWKLAVKKGRDGKNG